MPGEERRAQPHFARETEHVEHRRLVAVHARRQQSALPGGRWRFEAVEPFEDLAQAICPVRRALSSTYMPREEESA
jgi:hypothetical protein